MIKLMDNTDYYRRIYLSYAPVLLRFAEKYVSPFFAEDMVHDVFLKLWDKQIFRLPENELRNILYAAVRNSCIDHLRHLNLEQEFADKKAIRLKQDELDFFESSEELFMQKDIMEQIMKKINEMPDRRREIFQMAYIEGMKASEIAGKLNLSVRTVENQLYRILLYLRKKLSSSLIYLFLFL